MVIHIPGADSKRFSGIEFIPGIRGLEVGQVEYSLIHNGQGIGHRPAVFLAHRHREVFFRL